MKLFITCDNIIITSDKFTYKYFMNINKEYDELRDSLAIGIARMAEIYDRTNKYDNEFETVFFLYN